MAAVIKVNTGIAYSKQDISMDYESASRQYKEIVDFVKKLSGEAQTQFVKVLYPLFVQFYLDLVIDSKNVDAKKFLNEHSPLFLKASGYEEPLAELGNLSNVEDIIQHPIFHLYRIDKFEAEISKEHMDLFQKYLYNNKLWWSLRIVETFFKLQCKDESGEISNQNEETRKLEDLKDVIFKLNDSLLELPSILLYSLKKAHDLKFHRINMSHNTSVVACADEEKSIYLWKSTNSEMMQNHKNVQQKSLNGIPTVLHGHADRVNNLVFHPTDRLLFSCSRDSTIKAWSVNNDYKMAATYKGEDASVFDMDISSDGIHFASASSDNTVCLFNIVNSKPLFTSASHQSSVNCIKFDSDGKYFASGSKDKSVLIWSTGINNPINCFLHHGNISTLEFSPYRNYLSSVCENVIQIWDFRNTETPLRKIHCDLDISSLSFNINGRILAAATSNMIHFYDLDIDDINKPFGTSYFSSDVRLARFDRVRSHLLSSITISDI